MQGDDGTEYMEFGRDQYDVGANVSDADAEPDDEQALRGDSSAERGRGRHGIGIIRRGGGGGAANVVHNLAALGLRIVFALAVTQLMQLVGLVFAGGLLLVWVAWKMWRELRVEAGEGDEADVVSATVPRSFAAA